MLVFSALILNDLAHHLWCNTRMESYFRIVWEKLNCIRSTAAQGYYARTPPHPPIYSHIAIDCLHLLKTTLYQGMNLPRTNEAGQLCRLCTESSFGQQWVQGSFVPFIVTLMRFKGKETLGELWGTNTHFSQSKFFSLLVPTYPFSTKKIFLQNWDSSPWDNN